MPEHVITLSRIPTRAQAEAIAELGPGATVQHPRARHRGARAKLIRQLTERGLPRRVALTLRWTTEGAPPQERAPLECEPVPELVSDDLAASQAAD
jgi:hypothetical protein